MVYVMCQNRIGTTKTTTTMKNNWLWKKHRSIQTNIYIRFVCIVTFHKFSPFISSIPLAGFQFYYRMLFHTIWYRLCFFLSPPLLLFFFSYLLLLSMQISQFSTAIAQTVHHTKFAYVVNTLRTLGILRVNDWLHSSQTEGNLTHRTFHLKYK